MKPIHALAEWKTIHLPHGELTAADERFLTRLAGESKIECDFLREGVRIRARSWVGIIELGGCIVRIEPKLAGGAAHLVEMLAWTRGLDGLKRFDHARTLHADAASGLFDLLALLLAEACERVARRGLLHDYALREEPLPVLRGQLRVAEQVRRHFGRIDTLECRYDDHTSDVVENQLLAFALSLCVGRVQNGGVGRKIGRMHTLFHRAANPNTLHLPTARCPVWNRRNRHYRAAHQLAWLIIDGLQVNDLLATGATAGFSFLLDMNALFEAFVEKLVRELVDETWSVRGQAQLNTAIWHVEGDRSYQQIRPDVVIENGERCIVIDAKYKLYDGRRIDSADIYQMFLYGRAFSAETVYLFYPTTKTMLRTTTLHIRDGRQSDNTQIISVGLPLAQLVTAISGMSADPVGSELTDLLISSWA